jgi:hypothetical protein
MIDKNGMGWGHTEQAPAPNLPRSITPNIPINSHVLCITEEILHHRIHHASARSAAFQLPCVRDLGHDLTFIEFELGLKL